MTMPSYSAEPSLRVRSEVDVSYFEPSVLCERQVSTRASVATESLESVDFFESSLFEETLILEEVSESDDMPKVTSDPETIAVMLLQKM